MTKTSITIPDDIYQQAKVATDNFSALVAVALERYLRINQIEKAKASFGKWQGRGDASVKIVNALRAEEGRNNAGHSH
jgi:post-segregation antitoxin (ccd killing protein)